MSTSSTRDLKIHIDSSDSRTVSRDSERKHHKHKKEKKKDKKKDKKKHKHKHKSKDKDREKPKGNGRQSKTGSPREDSMDSDDLLDVLEKKKVQLLDMKEELKEKTLGSKLIVQKEILENCVQGTSESVRIEGKCENTVSMEVDINDLPVKVEPDISLPESLDEIPIPASPGKAKSNSNGIKRAVTKKKELVEIASGVGGTGGVELEEVPLPPPQPLDSIPIPDQADLTKQKASTEKIKVSKSSPTVKPNPVSVPPSVTPPPEKTTINIPTPTNFQATIRESMLREVGKAETSLPQNIVDDFFKDFLASKMKQIESEYMYKLMTKQLTLEGENKADDGVASSVEEMNKLLDEELCTIATATQKNDKKKSSKWDCKEKPDSGVATEAAEDHKEGETLNKPRVEVQIGTKKGGKLQMEFRITKTSADMISSGEIVKSKELEDGEVSSSSDDESDSEDSADKEDVSETGSLSSSDKDSKSSKKTKKKKKEKKKRKKKHKTKDAEMDSHSKRKHSHKSRSRSPKRRKSSKSRERTRSRSRSREKSSSSKYMYDAYQYRDKGRDRYDRDRERRYRDDRGRDPRRLSTRDSRDDKDHHRRKSRSKSRSRSRSKSKERPFRVSADLRVKIDKAKLREIAIKNALAMAKSGQVPSIDLATIKSGGKSIDELTDFCKRISSKSKSKMESSSSSSEEEEGGTGGKNEEDEFIHHPFKVKDTSSIVLNIRDAKPLPIRTPAEKLQESATLRLQFPVSSGSTHRLKESEWVPVEKTTATATITTAAPATTTVAATTTTAADSVLMPPPPMPSPALLPPVEAPPTPVRPEDRVFPEVPSGSIDIGAIISERLSAFKKLKENPNDIDAVMTLGKVQEKASLWAQSKNLPGKFLGSTGAHIMSHDELIGPDKKRQAWAKRGL
uniref:Protein SON-like isoform X3 n=1 Tax=Crassostrea virginica TaxID=6565 RepID=A0A8B8APU7_CRAVI|nr:protein SON-like isoform X3 [Crassostrea virginica]